MAGLVVVLHHAALATGIAPLDALRTRAAQRDIYAVGDEYPMNGFIAVTARLASWPLRCRQADPYRSIDGGAERRARRRPRQSDAQR